METIYVKEIEKETKLPYFMVKKERFIKEGDIHIYEIPIFKRKKNYIKICKYLKKKGVKNIIFSQQCDKYLLYNLKRMFYYTNGEEAFYNAFLSILSFFAKKKEIPLKESKIVFISNQPKKTEKLIKKIHKKVKEIKIYTEKKETFEKLAENITKEYGIYIKICGKDMKPQKYQHIYINIEEKRFLKEDFFINCNIIDIYNIYQGGYRDILFYYKTPYDVFLKEYKIEKRLQITSYFMEKEIVKKEKNYKIINIFKL